MKCEFCDTEISVKECMFARKKVIDGKEHYFCCDRCLEEFESKG